MSREKREEAIKTLENMKKGLYPWNTDEVLDMAINALQQEPCEDAVSRELVKKDIARWIGYIDEDMIARMHITIDKLPSVITEKTGHWILLDECSNSGYYCSECHKKVVKEGWSETVKKIKFCPNCGAKMVEPQESEDKE